VSERPPWEPRSRLEVEREVSDMKKRDRELGDSLGWIVDTLLQDESSVDDLERLQRKRREAVESLSYIRDVLISDAMELDHERLVGEEEALRRKKAKMRAEAERKQPVTVPPATVTQPLPVSTIDSRTRQATERAFARSPPRAAVPAAPATVGRKQGLQQAPPWNYTRSSFTTPAAAAVPPASLPRMPPPTSTRMKPVEPTRSTGAPATTKLHDPLGALG
jgi:TBC1 domain family protein 5